MVSSPLLRLSYDVWPDGVYAIGDVHGCIRQLREIEARIVSDAAPAVQKEKVKAAMVAARFFADPPPLRMAAYSQVSIEELVLQIENHVRLEHAAAESFLASPNASLLHSRTISTLVN